jgi:hypothetical protein
MTASRKSASQIDPPRFAGADDIASAGRAVNAPEAGGSVAGWFAGSGPGGGALLG